MSEDTIQPRGRAPDGERVTWLAILANLILIGVKGVAGVLGTSQALVADAVHSVSDFVTDAIVLAALRWGREGPDDDHHFGHGRIETLASGVVGTSLLVVAGYLAYDAVTDAVAGNLTQPGLIALGGAGLSVVVKEALYQVTARVGRRIQSAVVMANAWHHRSDALSSLAVLAGVGAARLYPEWPYFDTVATVLVAGLVGKVGVDIMRDAVREIIDAAPPAEVMDRLQGEIEGVEGVMGCHDMRIRTVGGRYHVQVHIEVDGELSVKAGHDIADRVAAQLRIHDSLIDAVIVHVDPAGLFDHDDFGTLAGGGPT